jgi:hypothetical protein
MLFAGVMPAACMNRPMSVPAATAGAPAPSALSLVPPAMAMPGPVQAPRDADSLHAAYGMPDFVRREKDSELWRYDAHDCTAFFFLYRDGETWRLRYSESLPPGRNMAASEACVQNLRARVSQAM